MAITGTGSIAGPIWTLRALLSTLAAVQSWMGVDGEGDPAAAALARIHYNTFDDPFDTPGDETDKAAGEAARPLIFLSHYDLTAEGAGESYWGKTGTIEIAFEEIAQNASGVETADNPVDTFDAQMHIMNNVGAIMDAVEAAITAGGTTWATTWTIQEQAGRESLGSRKSYMDMAGMRIHLGIRDMT